MKKHIYMYMLLFLSSVGFAQNTSISGKVTAENHPVPYASVGLLGTAFGETTDSLGRFFITDIPEGVYTLKVSSIGYENYEKKISLKNGEPLTLIITLKIDHQSLDEVVVTGVSQATLIRENPIAIVSVSPKQIEQTSESNIIDVLVKNVPGLQAVKTGPNISKPFIRGLGYNRVLTLYDGMRQEGQQWGDEHGIEIDAYNIDRVEVIKGPASLLYGSDALAGVVSFFSFIPSEQDGKLHGKFTSEYQTNNNLIGNGLRFDYSDKHFLYAVRGAYRMAKDYRNAIDGRVYLTNFSEKNFSALLGYQTHKGFTHFNFTLYDNLQGIPDGSRDSLSRRFTRQIYEGTQDTITKRPLVSDEDLNTYKVPALAQHIQHYRAYLRSHYALGKGNTDILLGLQQNIRREYNHPTAPEQAGMFVRLNTFNYGFRYTTPSLAGIKTSIGFSGMLQQNKNKNATDFPIPDYTLYDGGVYLYAKWKHVRWSMSGGARYDMRQVQWKDFYIRNNASTGFDQHVNPPDTAGASLPFSAYQKNFQGVSASIGMTFRVTEKISLKTNIGRAYRAPNITEMSSNGLDPGAHIIYLGNRNFNPEFSLQEDLGISGRFANLSGEASVFHNTIQNYIYQTLVTDGSGNAILDAQGNKTYQYQQASAQLYGAELWFAYHPEKLTGFRFENSLSFVYGFNRKSTYKGEGVNGEYLPYIPPLKLLSSLSQKIKTRTAHLLSFTPKIELEWAAAQNRYLNLNHTETYTPGYILLHGGVATEIQYSDTHTLQFILQVNNILDVAYQSNLSRLKYFEYYAQSSNGHRGVYNMGRNICFKLIALF